MAARRERLPGFITMEADFKSRVFQGKPSEENVWRCMKALLKFCTIGSREVPQLVKMIGPEPSKFTGMSARVDELVEPIMARLASVPMF